MNTPTVGVAEPGGVAVCILVLAASNTVPKPRWTATQTTATTMTR